MLTILRHLQRLVVGTLLTLDGINEKRYGLGVIRSFRDAETEKVFQRERSRRLPPALQRQARRRVLLLNAAQRSLGGVRSAEIQNVYPLVTR